MERNTQYFENIKIEKNPLTGDWFVYPPTDREPYVVATLQAAKKLIKRMKSGKRC